MESLCGSSKRAKTPSSSANNSSNPHCLVDGCNADLSVCRDYHRRHKVCEMHSKTSCVAIGGRDQRFCQQCSRFHSLVEFDEGKRSCRKRLDGHNRRRRKPHPEYSISLPRNNDNDNPACRRVSFSTNQTTSTTLLSFTSTTPKMLSTHSVNSSSSWSTAVKSEHDMMLYNNSNRQQINQINNWQNAVSECSSGHRGGSTISSNRFFCSDGLNNQVVDCDRALSLLSSAHYQQVVRFQTTEQLFPRSLEHSSTTGLSGHDYNNPSKYAGHQVNKDAIIYGMDSHGTLHFQEMLCHDHPQEGYSTSGEGSHQTLTNFMWG